MSVYTKVTENQLADWLRRYAVGELLGHEGIASGIENTNYFVTTSHGRFVLTLFEQHTAEELPFYLDLMDHLAAHGVPCPRPIASVDAGFLGQLNGRPAAIVTRLPGRSVERPGIDNCRQVGDMLATMHRAGRGFPSSVPNPRGHAWRLDMGRRLAPLLGGPARSMLEAELANQARQDDRALPRGIVHADLFRDNILFDRQRLTGVIDFYYACEDTLVYDLAVTVNDWCVDDNGRPDPGREAALVTAYREQRPMQPEELAAWPRARQAAALRFWLSRLHDLHYPRPGELTHAKDPEHFRRLLSHLQQCPATMS